MKKHRERGGVTPARRLAWLGVGWNFVVLVERPTDVRRMIFASFSFAPVAPGPPTWLWNKARCALAFTPVLAHGHHPGACTMRCAIPCRLHRERVVAFLPPENPPIIHLVILTRAVESVLTGSEFRPLLFTAQTSRDCYQQIEGDISFWLQVARTFQIKRQSVYKG